MPVLHEIPFSDFVATRSPRLLHLAYLLTRDRGQAEDLLQTSLARAWPVWGRITDPEAYVRRIMVNTYAAWWRRKWNGEVPTERLPERISADPHGGVDAREEMLAALRRLPRQQRAVLVLRYYEDLSDGDIAEILGISPGTVRSHGHKALAALRLDAILAASALQPPEGAPAVAVSAVMLRVAQRRRRRIAAIAAACVGVVVLLLGYALNPHRRSAPPTHPSPHPTSFAPFVEYETGTRMADVQTITRDGPARFTWTANGEDVVLKFQCADTPRHLLVRFQLSLNGGKPWEDGLCVSYGTGSGGSVTAEQQSAAGIVAGEPVELTVALTDTATDRDVDDPDKRRVPMPADTKVIAGLAVTIPYEDFPFPPKPTVSASPFLIEAFGPAAITSAADPMRSRSTVITWSAAKRYLGIIHAGGPVRLQVLVDGRPFTTCATWTYTKSDTGFDLSARSPELKGYAPAEGAPVTITIVPLNAAEPWNVWLREAPPAG